MPEDASAARGEPRNDAAVVGASMLLAPDEGGEGFAVLRDYGLRYEHGEIRELAPYAQLADAASAAQIPCEFLDRQLLMPGLVNCHGHAAMSLLRGFADDMPLQQWLEGAIWPAEAALVDEEFVRDGATLAIAEMLRSGTTTFSDMYFFPDVTAAVAESSGMRAQINFPILEFASTWASDAEDYLSRGLTLLDNYRHSERVQIGFGPHAPYTVSDATFSRVAVLAAEVDAHVQLHLQETAGELQQSQREHGCSPAERLQRLGLLGPRTQAVHFAHFSEQDAALLSETGTPVIHCPVSNAKLGSGYCAVDRLLEAGIVLGLGTDSAASNNTLDLFETARVAALLAKLERSDASALPAQQCLHMATQGGANALGLGDSIGSLEPGKRADFIAVDTRTPALQPMHNPMAQLVYSAAGSAVSHAWVDGRCLLRERKLQNIDSAALLECSAQWRERISRHSKAQAPENA